MVRSYITKISTLIILKRSEIKLYKYSFSSKNGHCNAFFSIKDELIVLVTFNEESDKANYRESHI